MCRIIWGKIQGLSFAVTHSVYIFFPTKKSKARKLKITYIIFNFHTRVFLVTQEGIIAAGNSILCLTWQSVKIESVKIKYVDPEIVLFFHILEYYALVPIPFIYDMSVFAKSRSPAFFQTSDHLSNISQGSITPV